MMTRLGPDTPATEPSSAKQGRLTASSVAAELLQHYADFIRTVKADDLERHPYSPLIEDVISDLRALSTQPPQPQPVGEDRSISVAEESDIYMTEAVNSSPQPLQDLGKYLAELLDEDQWKKAESLLNAAVLASLPTTPTEPVKVDDDERPTQCRERLREEGKAYPRSGCMVCRTSVQTGVRCLFRRSAALTEQVKPADDGEVLKGLSTDENKVMTVLVEAWNQFLRLPVQHPDDVTEFRFSIHRLQEKLLARHALTIIAKPKPADGELLEALQGWLRLEESARRPKTDSNTVFLDYRDLMAMVSDTKDLIGRRGIER